jgi:hypothetical protein
VELICAVAALSLPMEINPNFEPVVLVFESDDGVLNVIIQTVDDDELEILVGQRNGRKPTNPSP